MIRTERANNKHNHEHKTLGLPGLKVCIRLYCCPQTILPPRPRKSTEFVSQGHSKTRGCSKMHNLQIYIFSRQRSHLMAHTNASHTSSGRIERRKKGNKHITEAVDGKVTGSVTQMEKAWWRGLTGRDRCWEIKRQWRTRQRELEASF